MRIVLGITDISSFGQCILLGNFWKPQEKYNSEQLHRMFYNKGVLRNFSKLTKGTFNEIFFIMFQAWACNFDKKGLLSHYYVRFFYTQRWYQIHMQSKKGLCVALHNLVPFVRFKKREKHPWRSVTFSKACNFAKRDTPLWVFFTFFKLCNWCQIAQHNTYIKNWISIPFYIFCLRKFRKLQPSWTQRNALKDVSPAKERWLIFRFIKFQQRLTIVLPSLALT